MWDGLPLRKKPMNVPASVAHIARGSRIRPVKIEERGHCGIQLRLALPEEIVFADLTAECEPRDLNFLRLLLSK
jgi:hypothetical protein